MWHEATTYVMCRLQYDETVDGQVRSHSQTAWIPEEFAEVGHVLKLRCPKGMWVNGWEVMETFQKSNELGSVTQAHRAFMKVIG